MTVTHQLQFEPTTDDEFISRITCRPGGSYDSDGLYDIEFTPSLKKKADYRVTLDIDVAFDIQGPPVEGVSASASSSTSLDFTWDAYPDATEYTLVLRQAGTVIEEQTITAPTATASFTGLTASTEYHLDIQPKTAGRDGARSIHAASTTA
nr:fibronectin type III domain-containing protein [Halomonas gemina]